MKLIRDGSSYIVPTEEIELKQSLMSVFILKFSTNVNIKEGDKFKVKYAGEEYTFDYAKQEGEEVTANHISYQLMNYAVLDRYFNDPPTYDDTIDFADAKLSDLVSGFLSPLYSDAGYTLTNNVTTENDTKQDISFNGDNLLSALQGVAEAYGIEFYLKDFEVVLCDAVGQMRDVVISEGIHTNEITKSIDTKNICSKIYPNGSTENLPELYYYTRLKPTLYNEVATDKSEAELFIMWNEDYPEWEGTRAEWNTALAEWDNTQETWKTHFQPLWTGNFTLLQTAIADWHDYLALSEGVHYHIDDSDMDGNPPLSLFVEKNVSELGVIERVIEFSDIKPKSRRGTIDSTGEGDIEGTTFPYIEDSDLHDIDVDLAQNYDNVGLMITDGNLHRAEDLNVIKIDTATNRLYYSTKLKEPEGAEVSFTPPVGSTYVLVGYITPEEVNVASQELYDKAVDYLDNNQTPIEEYKTDELLFKNDPEFFVGDFVRLVSKKQGIDVNIRIQEVDYDPETKVYKGLKFSTQTDIIPDTFLRNFLNTRAKLLQLQGSLDAYYAQMGFLAEKLSELNNEILVNLQNNLQELDDDLDYLNETTLPGLQSDLGALETDLNTLNTTTIPNLEGEISDNESAISTLNNTTVPNLQTQLNEKLDDLPGEITETLIADDSITTPKLVANAVTANEIAAGTITANNIAAGTITALQIASNTITTNEIAAGTITANNIAAGVITALEIASDTITANEISTGTITASEIKGNTITANEIAVGTITTNEISAGTITANNLAADSVTTTQISTDAVTANEIEAGAILSTHIAVGGIDKTWLNETLESEITESTTEINEMSSDSKITPTEKLTLKREFGNIQEEYTKYSSQATTFAIDGRTVFTDYQTAYNNLDAYVSPLVSDLNTTSNITGSTLRSKFADYYDKRGTFLEFLSSETRAGSAVSIGVSDDGSGVIEVKDEISDITGYSHYWTIDKSGFNYDVFDSGDKIASLQGGNVIKATTVNYDPDVNELEFVPIYTLPNGSYLGLDNSRVRAITSLSSVNMLAASDTDPQILTTAETVTSSSDDSLVVGYNVSASQTAADYDFDTNDVRLSINSNYKLLDWVNLPDNTEKVSGIVKSVTNSDYGLFYFVTKEFSVTCSPGNVGSVSIWAKVFNSDWYFLKIYILSNEVSESKGMLLSEVPDSADLGHSGSFSFEYDVNPGSVEARFEDSKYYLDLTNVKSSVNLSIIYN